MNEGLAADAPSGARGNDGVANDETAAPGTSSSTDGGLDDVLTVEDVAELLRLGRNVVYEAVGRGEIPHRRIGRLIRFSRSAIMRWLASCGAAEDKEHR